VDFLVLEVFHKVEVQQIVEDQLVEVDMIGVEDENLVEINDRLNIILFGNYF
jgi:hypothetical protein